MTNDLSPNLDHRRTGLGVTGVVIVTPSATYHPWNASLVAGIKAAGYEPISYGGELELPFSECPQVIVTHDPLLVKQVRRDWTVAILGDIATSAAQCSSLFGTTPEGGLQIASLILANMALLPENTIYLSNDLTGSVVRIAADIDVVVPTTREEWAPTTSEEAFQEALSLYRGWPDAPRSSARWEPGVFRFDERHKSPDRPDCVVELAGRARALVYGPYIGLRPGRWSVTAKFIVDKDAAAHRFRFEWGHAGSSASFTQSPGRAGEFAVTLAHDWHEPALAEFKIIVAQGSLGGELEFLGADLERLGGPTAADNADSGTAPETIN